MLSRAHRRVAPSIAALTALVLALTLALFAGSPARALVPVSISGTVTLPGDAPAEYLNGVSAWATQTDGADTGHVAVSTVDGTYSIPGLDPGHYRVQFKVASYDIGGGAVTPALFSEFYAGAYTSATSMAVDASASVGGIDASLEWTGSIAGTVAIEAPSPSTWLKGVVVKVTGPGGLLATKQVNATTGAYEITGLPPGNYAVNFTAIPYLDGVVVHPGFLEEFFDDVYGLTGSTPVALPEHGAVTGIDATLSTVGHFTLMPNPTIKADSIGFASVLGSSTGVWLPAPTSFTFQWKRDGAPIAGATAGSYELVDEDQNTSLTLTLTANKTDFTSQSRTSDPLALALFFIKAPTPTVTGTATAGSTLTAHKGTWLPTPSATSYQWKRGGVPIAGATSASYVLKTLDRGTRVTVTVTSSKATFTTSSRTSDPLYVPKVFTAAATPTIAGTARSGFTLTAHRGTWAPTPTTVTYQWYRNGVKITGATKFTYKLTSLDKGKKIVVKVTGKKSLYLTTTKASAAKAIAP